MPEKNKMTKEQLQKALQQKQLLLAKCRKKSAALQKRNDELKKAALKAVDLAEKSANVVKRSSNLVKKSIDVAQEVINKPKELFDDFEKDLKKTWNRIFIFLGSLLVILIVAYVLANGPIYDLFPEFVGFFINFVLSNTFIAIVTGGIGDRWDSHFYF